MRIQKSPDTCGRGLKSLWFLKGGVAPCSIICMVYIFICSDGLVFCSHYMCKLNRGVVGWRFRAPSVTYTIQLFRPLRFTLLSFQTVLFFFLRFSIHSSRLTYLITTFRCVTCCWWIINWSCGLFLEESFKE